MEPVRRSQILRCHFRESWNPVHRGTAGATASRFFAPVKKSQPHPSRRPHRNRLLPISMGFDCRSRAGPTSVRSSDEVRIRSGPRDHLLSAEQRVALAVNASCREYDNAGELKLKHYGYGLVFVGPASKENPVFIGISAIGNLTNKLNPA